MNNWEKLCEQIIPLIKGKVVEDILHLSFESYLKTIFNWDETSIEHKPSVPMGRDIKQADIVLKGENFGIVIEMKHPGIALGYEEAIQLFSYMRYLQHKYGLLIGNEIKVYYDDDTAGNDPIEVVSFGFDGNNSDGLALCEILDKNICSNEKLKEYAIERIQQIQTKKEMEDLVNNNGEKIKAIVREKLVLKGYQEKNINDILENIVIFQKQETAFTVGRNHEEVNKRNGSDNMQIWNEWYYNVGEGPHRDWDDYKKYNFISAGQGEFWSKQLKKLKVGDKLFAYLKGRGYVGYGEVIQEAKPIENLLSIIFPIKNYMN